MPQPDLGLPNCFPPEFPPEVSNIVTNSEFPPQLIGATGIFGEFALLTVNAEGVELGSSPLVPVLRRYRGTGSLTSTVRKPEHNLGAILGFSSEVYAEEGMPGGGSVLRQDYIVFARPLGASASTMVAIRGWERPLPDQTYTSTLGHSFESAIYQDQKIHYAMLAPQQTYPEARFFTHDPRTDVTVRRMIEHGDIGGQNYYQLRLSHAVSDVMVTYATDWDFPRTVFVANPDATDVHWGPMSGTTSYDVATSLANTYLITDTNNGTQLHIYENNEVDFIAIDISSSAPRVPSKVVWVGNQAAVMSWDVDHDGPQVRFLNPDGALNANPVELPAPTASGAPSGLGIAVAAGIDIPNRYAAVYGQGGVVHMVQFNCGP